MSSASSSRSDLEIKIDFEMDRGKTSKSMVFTCKTKHEISQETLDRIPKGALFRDTDDRNDKFVLKSGNAYTGQIDALRKAQDACNTFLSAKMLLEKKESSGSH